MIILSIETSCDETSIALIERIEINKYKILSHKTISQINLHKEYGGVYPTLSKREHEKNIMPILHKVLEEGNLLSIKDDQIFNLKDFLGEDVELLVNYPILYSEIEEFFNKFSVSKIDYIAVTSGPGLPPALWVGVNFAKVISKILNNIPIYPINHLEGHIISSLSTVENNIVTINTPKSPSLALIISGGHTEMVLFENFGEYKKIGETKDDAVGEAYDKVARLLDLPYPGGPQINRLANLGRLNNLNYKDLDFPRPMFNSPDYNFSFSGLKTHILYFVNNLKENNLLNEEVKIKIACEFEETVKDVFLKKINKAILNFGIKSLIIGGGVASNTFLKDNFEKFSQDNNLDFYISSRDLSTDNALMIALTASIKILNNISPEVDFIAIGSKNYNWTN